MNRKTCLFLSFLLMLCTGCHKEAQPAVRIAEESAAETTAADPETTETTEQPTAAQTEPETTAPVLHEPPEGIVLIVDQTIEIYEKLTVRELLSAFNGELLNPDDIVDTSETGTFEAAISYTYKGTHYAHTVSYTVEDTTPPLLLNSGYDVQVKLGDTYDLNTLVGFADNYDRAPVLTSWGTVDTGVCGAYPVKAVVTDASGNSISWDLNVHVVEQKSEPDNNAPRLTFDALREQYAADNVRFGIDISRWQKDVDFAAVRDAGCEFVLMHMGYYYDEMKMDEYYLTNMQKAQEAGLEVGVYIYTTANTEEEVRENARWIAQQLDGQALNFPVIFDWESFSNYQKYGMNIHDLNMLFEVFAEEMQQHGYPVMLYSSRNFLRNFWYEQKEHPVWLAHYTDQTNYEGNYVMWQMSDKGRIHGITGDVDFNLLYTDKMKEYTDD